MNLDSEKDIKIASIARVHDNEDSEEETEEENEPDQFLKIQRPFPYPDRWESYSRRQYPYSLPTA